MRADESYGQRVAQALGLDVETARKLRPLEGKPAPGTTRSATANVPGVKNSGPTYAASMQNGANGNTAQPAGATAVMERVFSLAEATGAR